MAENTRIGMDGVQVVDLAAEFIGQVLIRGMHVGKERIAAHGWNHAATENRSKRRLFSPGNITMPTVLARFRVFIVVNHNDLGVVRVVCGEGMDLEFAKTSTKGDMVLAAHILVAEENNLPIQERLPDFRDCLIAALAIHAEAGDLSTNRGR